MGAIKAMYLPCHWKTDPLFKMECYMHENVSYTSHSIVQLFYTNPKQRAFLMTDKVFIGPVQQQHWI